MTRFRVVAPAKLNLSLGVGPRRADGFHELVTVFSALDLADEVVAELADGAELVVAGRYAADLNNAADSNTEPDQKRTSDRSITTRNPVVASNLAIRAAEALARQAGIPADVRLTITKRIPVAAGLAGGSTDAAAALIACDAVWGLRTPRRVLVELAAELGSDVPFCLLGGVAIGTGRGELLRPTASPRPFHWVLVPSIGALSTPAVYGELDRLRSVGEVSAPTLDATAGAPATDMAIRCQAVTDAVTSADPTALAAVIYNDLQPAAVSLDPSLAVTLKAGEAAGALAGIVCGSGPTCAFLARDSGHATEIARGLAVASVLPRGISPLIATSGGPGVHLCL